MLSETIKSRIRTFASLGSCQLYDSISLSGISWTCRARIQWVDTYYRCLRTQTEHVFSTTRADKFDLMFSEAKQYLEEIKKQKHEV